MITVKCLLGFPTHNSLITVEDTGHITVFKFNGNAGLCDWDSFNDQLEAADFIMTPLASTFYYVKIDGEDPLHKI